MSPSDFVLLFDFLVYLSRVLRMYVAGTWESRRVRAYDSAIRLYISETVRASPNPCLFARLACR
jgi:hypothetical protein